MGYIIIKNDKIVYEVDCIYDLNSILENPFSEPLDGDWHSLDTLIEEELERLGYTIEERTELCS